MLLFGAFVSMLFRRWVYLHMDVIFCFLPIGISCFCNVNTMLETLRLLPNHVFESRKSVIQNYGGILCQLHAGAWQTTLP
jgi:hypothetical protein